MSFTVGIVTDLIYIPWVQMGILFNSNQVFLPATDDGFVGPIQIPPGFPFGSSVQTQVFVSTMHSYTISASVLNLSYKTTGGHQWTHFIWYWIQQLFQSTFPRKYIYFISLSGGSILGRCGYQI